LPLITSATVEPPPLNRFRIVWAALACATLLKLYLALTTAGTLDAAAFADHLAKIREHGGVGAYHMRGAFNNPFNSPPFVVHALRAMGRLGDATGLPFAFWLRLPGVLADAGSLLLVWRLLAREQPRRDLRWPLLVVALSPVLVIISGHHGNTDTVMIFFALLSVYLAGRGGGAWLAGAAFGMALNVKAVPLLLIPAVWFYLPAARRRAEFFGAAAAVFLTGSLPYLARDPAAIARAVFGYGSLYGHWGWSYLLARWLPGSLQFANPPHDVAGVHAVYASAGKWLLLSLVVGLAYGLNLRRPKPPLFFQCGLAFALFLLLTPGFGSQYLSWPVPWLAAVGLRAALTYNVLAGLVLLFSYWHFPHAFVGPIYSAAGRLLGGLATPPAYDVSTVIYALMLLCWASTLLLLLAYCRMLRRGRGAGGGTTEREIR